MPVLYTDRLILRKFLLGDAKFILQLVNEPDFLRYVGDKGIRTMEDARNYIRNGPLESYHLNGFGLYLVELKETGCPIGLCGILKRDILPSVDIGYAFLSEYQGNGYAIEAAREVLSEGEAIYGLARILAVIDPENVRSIHLVEQLGMHSGGMTHLAEDGPELRLFST